MNKRTRLSGSALLFLLVLVLSPGCASFPGRELPSYTFEQIPAQEKKIAASFDTKFFGPRGENKKVQAKLEKRIEELLAGGPVFGKVDMNATDGEYHYSFVFRDEGNEALAFLSGFISGFTFTIVPAYARDTYLLSVEVKQGDKVVKTYTYRDHMNSWIQGLLIVVTPLYWPPTVSESIMDNMVLNFVHDFSADVSSGVYLAQTSE